MCFSHTLYAFSAVINLFTMPHRDGSFITMSLLPVFCTTSIQSPLAAIDPGVITRHRRPLALLLSPKGYFKNQMTIKLRGFEASFLIFDPIMHRFFWVLLSMYAILFVVCIIIPGISIDVQIRPIDFPC